jgi:hypothetical protein
MSPKTAPRAQRPAQQEWSPTHFQPENSIIDKQQPPSRRKTLSTQVTPVRRARVHQQADCLTDGKRDPCKLQYQGSRPGPLLPPVTPRQPYHAQQSQKLTPRLRKSPANSNLSSPQRSTKTCASAKPHSQKSSSSYSLSFPPKRTSPRPSCRRRTSAPEHTGHPTPKQRLSRSPYEGNIVGNRPSVVEREERSVKAEYSLRISALKPPSVIKFRPDKQVEKETQRKHRIDRIQVYSREISPSQDHRSKGARFDPRRLQQISNDARNQGPVDPRPLFTNLSPVLNLDDKYQLSFDLVPVGDPQGEMWFEIFPCLPGRSESHSRDKSMNSSRYSCFNYR